MRVKGKRKYQLGVKRAKKKGEECFTPTRLQKMHNTCYLVYVSGIFHNKQLSASFGIVLFLVSTYFQITLYTILMLVKKCCS
jgi:hypothetical protein